MITKNYFSILLYFQATVVNFETVLCDLSYCKLKDVNPRGWKVSLSFGNIFSITVSGYKKVLAYNSVVF